MAWAVRTYSCCLWARVHSSSGKTCRTRRPSFSVNASSRPAICWAAPAIAQKARVTTRWVTGACSGCRSTFRTSAAPNWVICRIACWIAGSPMASPRGASGFFASRPAARSRTLR
ncbi:hypothetical protein SCALM49S_08821 [Streptomyces californicus]